jgi:ribosomal protein S20
MPIIKSAKKRVKVAGKAAVRNSKTKRSLKGAVKAFHAAVKKIPAKLLAKPRVKSTKQQRRT